MFYLFVALPITVIAGVAQSRTDSHEMTSETNIDVSAAKAAIEVISNVLQTNPLPRTLLHKLAMSANSKTPHKVKIKEPLKIYGFGYPSNAEEARVEILFEEIKFIAADEQMEKSRLHISVFSRITILNYGVYCSFEGARNSYDSAPRSLSNWTADNGSHFAKELDKAVNVLSRSIGENLFLDPKVERVSCDYYNSPMAINLKDKLVADATRKLEIGKSTKRDVERVFGTDYDEHSLSFGQAMRYFRPVEFPDADGKLTGRWVWIDVLLDDRDIVQIVVTSLHADTAIHSIDKIIPGRSTRFDVVRFLGEPDINDHGTPHFQYVRSWPRAWALEVLLDRDDRVTAIYSRYEKFARVNEACAGARRGSPLAQADLSALYWEGHEFLPRDEVMALKWDFIGQKYGAKPFLREAALQGIDKERIAKAKGEATAWTPESQCP